MNNQQTVIPGPVLGFIIVITFQNCYQMLM